DGLDPNLPHALDICRIGSRLVGDRICLNARRCFIDDLTLRIVELAPACLVHEKGDLGPVEAWVNTILRLFMPAQIEDASSRPAVAIDDATLERRINLAWRRLHNRRAEGSEEIAIDRGDADFQPGKVRLCDRLRKIDVERRIADLPGQENCVHLLFVEL